MYIHITINNLDGLGNLQYLYWQCYDSASRKGVYLKWADSCVTS